MKNKFLIFTGLVVLASCGRYSQVKEAPQKEEMQANTRVYGEYGQPARQSKKTFTNPEDANDRSAKIKEVMFGEQKNNLEESTPVSSDSTGSETKAETQAGS